jgi:plasmid stabilization system protein ParE
MAVEINWTVEAIETFDGNIEYLLKAWSEKEAKKFVQQTEQLLSNLLENPQMYRPSLQNKKVRRARVNKYVTLYYRYYAVRKKIVLLSFWNIKQDPDKLLY